MFNNFVVFNFDAKFYTKSNEIFFFADIDVKNVKTLRMFMCNHLFEIEYS